MGGWPQKVVAESDSIKFIFYFLFFTSQLQKHLVRLLTTKEINKARDNFRAFDTDLDGSITEYEARRAYKRWYGNFVQDPADLTPSER